MTLPIREMTASDIEEVLTLWRATENLGLDEDADTQEGVAAYLERNPGMSFVACEDETLVGAVLCGTDGRRGYLSHLAVATSHRRQGIGRALVGACMDALKQAGIPRCNTFVYAENEAGLAFWRSIGWRGWEEFNVTAMSYDIG